MFTEAAKRWIIRRMGMFIIAVIILFVIISVINYNKNKTGSTDFEHKNAEIRRLQDEIRRLQDENEALKRQPGKQAGGSPIPVAKYKTPQTDNVIIPIRRPVMENWVEPEGFDRTGEFGRGFELMENSNYNLFITGKAGTGKSTLLQYFRQKTKKRVVCVAFTGVAARNIGGQTIHSFFQLPPEVITLEVLEDVRHKKWKQEVLTNTDMVIIDEISMVRADLLYGVDMVLGRYRDREKPFGGVRMVFIGDMYQLPPIIDKGTQAYFHDVFNGKYFFKHSGFQAADFKFFELRTSYRHKDDGQFFELLNAVRENTITDEQLERLNERHITSETDPRDVVITLCARNAEAEKENDKMMKKLETKSYTFKAAVKGDYKKIAEEEPNTCPAPPELELKQGAQIMMVKNHKDKLWVNGSIGHIKKVNDNEIVVEINGLPYQVDREKWEKIKYVYDKETKTLSTESVGSFEQYPLMPAWAITVHKSQGKTFERVNIDLGQGAFEFGQAYVALSRCKTLAGITLARPITRADIKPVSNEVKEFLKGMSEKTIT